MGNAPDDHVGDPALKQRMRLLPYAVRELLAGGVAGGFAKTCVAPLERTKILFQTGKMTGSIFHTTVHIYQTEGVRGMFRGNGVSVLRIVPYSAIHLSAYEYYRLGLVHAAERQYPSAVAVYEQQVPPALDLVAGSCAGATAVLLTYPMDLVRTRLAYQTENGNDRLAPASSNGPATSFQPARSAAATAHRLTIRTLLASTWKQEGIAGLYRGIGPTLMGVLPYAGLKFYVYQSMKQQWRQWQMRVHNGQDVPHRLPVPLMLTFGASAGLVAQTLTYPLDVVRRRMQVLALQPSGSQQVGPALAYRSTTQTLYALFKHGGRKALFAGLGINYLKVVPSTAIGFTIYDAMKQYLGLPQNL